MPSRRAFFRQLPLATAAVALPPCAVVPTAHLPEAIEHPHSALARYNNEFRDLGYDHAERVGHYAIYFSGFIPAVDNNFVVGHWFGWRGDWAREQPARYFVATVPRAPTAPFGHYEYEYTLGATFRIDGRLQPDQFADPVGLRQIRAEVAEGRLRLLRVMQAAGVVSR